VKWRQMKCKVCEKHKENIREYFKLYRQRPYVKEKTKKYFKEYNARPDVKQRKHEEYVQKLIKEVSNATI
jgi:hypothetical protein